MKKIWLFIALVVFLGDYQLLCFNTDVSGVDLVKRAVFLGAASALYYKAKEYDVQIASINNEIRALRDNLEVAKKKNPPSIEEINKLQADIIEKTDLLSKPMSLAHRVSRAAVTLTSAAVVGVWVGSLGYLLLKEYLRKNYNIRITGIGFEYETF